MALHHLSPSPATLRGRYDLSDAPVLTIDPGDTVRFSTPDVTWGLSQHGDDGTRQVIETRDIGREGGPGMCGPVAVRGAEPGMMMAVHLEAIVPGSWGWTYVGPGHFDKGLGRAMGLGEGEWRLLRWTLDAEAGVGVSEKGHRVSLAPFMGTIGLAPGEPGPISGWLPRATGGNLDCKLLVAGTVLYLPIEAPGGRFYTGDGHARQGDGEVGGSAIECPMAQVDVRFELHEDMAIDGPQANTPEGWVTMGISEDLDEAVGMAMRGMLAVMEARFGVDRPDAVALASVAVDLRLTQLVNGVRGVHAVLPHGAIKL